MADNDEKARLYRRIVHQTPDAVLLERMKAHGFWPAGQGLPPDPPAEAAERTAIEAETEELRRTRSQVKDPEKALAEERKRRWEESKQRRAARKAEREVQRKERRAAWDARRAAELVHAGSGVSDQFHLRVSDVAELERQGLPVLHTASDLAAVLEVPLSRLRWLTFHRRGATLVHYHRFEIHKKTGGVRCISAPKPALKKAQQWVFANVLTRLDVEPEVHGFVPFRSIVTNAAPHCGRAVVVNLDLKDFFPTVTFPRVRGLFRRLGYSGHVATLLALLCTEPPRVAADFDGRRYYVALGERVLPQGACTSPAITNALCRRLDRRLAGLAKRHGFTYTRYADDLTFSGDERKAIGRLLKSARSILTDEGFTEHPRKTRVMRQARRQEVTGVTVNVRPTVFRRELRELRAILHNCARHGLAGQNRYGHPNFASYLRGRVAYACMVDPQRAPALRSALEAALASS